LTCGCGALHLSFLNRTSSGIREFVHLLAIGERHETVTVGGGQQWLHVNKGAEDAPREKGLAPDGPFACVHSRLCAREIPKQGTHSRAPHPLVDCPVLVGMAREHTTGREEEGRRGDHGGGGRKQSRLPRATVASLGRGVLRSRANTRARSLLTHVARCLLSRPGPYPLPPLAALLPPSKK